MAKKERVQHEGVVVKVSTQTLEVLIQSHSACSACHAKGACSMADMKQKMIVTQKPDTDIQIGDKVMVYASMNHAFYSVLLAYILPSILILTAIFFLEKSGSEELTAAITSLILLAVYFFILYLFRNKISHKIRFTVEKSNS